MTPAFLTSDQVAERLALANGKAFLRQRARLEADTLFPPPMPTQAKPLRWKAAEVDAWIARQGKPLPAAATPPQAADVPPAIRHGRADLHAIARSA